MYSQEEQKWKIRLNNELRAQFKRDNVAQSVRSTRLEWMRHVWRADGRLLKRALNEEMEETRPRGRPRRRWMDSVQETIWNLCKRISFSSKSPKKWLIY